MIKGLLSLFSHLYFCLQEDVFAEYITENVSDFPALLSKYCNGNSLMTFSNFVKVLCHLLNENL